MTVGCQRLQADAHQAVSAQSLDRLIGVGLFCQGFSQQIQKQVE